MPKLLLFIWWKRGCVSSSLPNNRFNECWSLCIFRNLNIFRKMMRRSAVNLSLLMRSMPKRGSKITTQFCCGWGPMSCWNILTTKPMHCFLKISTAQKSRSVWHEWFEHYSLIHIFSRQVKSLEKDTNFLKDQITVTEVNIARTHNFNVQQKKLSSSGK